MKKLILGVAALLVTACADKPYQGGWDYEHTEDSLRKLKITKATTHSISDPNDYGKSSVSLAVRKGSHDDDGVTFWSMNLNCNGHTVIAIRVDDHPIEHMVCSSPQFFHVNLPLESPLAQRIMDSEEVVIESGEQWVFRTGKLEM